MWFLGRLEGIWWSFSSNGFSLQAYIQCILPRLGSPPDKRPDPRQIVTEHIRWRLWRTINVERELFLYNVHNGVLGRGLIQMCRSPNRFKFGLATRPKNQMLACNRCVLLLSAMVHVKFRGHWNLWNEFMAVFCQRIRSLVWWTTQPWKERETIGNETPPNPFNWPKNHTGYKKYHNGVKAL